MLTDSQAGASGMDTLDPVRGYEWAALEQHLAAIEAECDHLRSEIAEAQRDELIVSSRPPSVAEQLGTTILEAQAELTAEWDACRRNEAALQEATEALASRVLAEARGQADALRTIAAKIRADGAAAPYGEAEQWWQDVIDLSQSGADESARTA